MTQKGDILVRIHLFKTGVLLILLIGIPIPSSGARAVNSAQTVENINQHSIQVYENHESYTGYSLRKKEFHSVPSQLNRPNFKIVSITAPSFYENSSPIIINGNTDFEAFPGDGSPVKPYSINNKNITDPTGSFNLIDIRNTDVYFNITNCLLQHGTRGIYLENVSNGYIYNNIIFNNLNYGIVLQDSNTNVISTNLVNNTLQEAGILLDQTKGNHLIFNTVCDGSSEGILILSSNTTIISNNFVSFNINEGLIIRKSRNCTISRNNIYNNGYRAGLDIDESRNSTFTDNIISNNYQGIYSSMSDNNSIKDNVIFNNSRYGIELGLSRFCTLSNLTIYNNLADGFYLWDSENCVIKDVSSFGNNRYEFSSDHANYITDCGNSTFSNINCSKNNGHGIYVHASENSLFSEITCSKNNRTGFYLHFSGNIELSDIFTFNNDIGLYLEDCNNSSIHNVETIDNKYSGLIVSGYSEPYNYTFSNINSSFNNGNGITFNHIQNSIIFNSEIHNNSKNGISIYNSPYITLVSNDVFNNGNKSDYYNDYGISLYAESNECNLTLNKVFSNENGISIDSVNKSILSLNFIYDNIGNGIEISYSAGNIIDNNIIWHNRDYGITGYYWFESGDPIPENNIIKLNDFIGNRYQTAEFYQAYCDGLCYEFDHNFWDNYRVPDDDKDGIVDYKLKVGRLGQSNYYDEYNYDENPETEPNNDYSSIHYLTSPIITSPTSWDPANPDDWSRTQINGTITIRWLESLDTENHKVTYSLYYLQLGFGWDEQNWTEISSGLTITSYDWDTTNVIDGQYYLMINATCSHGLNSFYKEEWGEFEINNSPPVLTDAYASFPPFILFLIFVLTLGTIKKYQRKP